MRHSLSICLDRGVSRGVCKTRGVRFPALALSLGIEPLYVVRPRQLKSGPGTSLPKPSVFCQECWVGAGRSLEAKTTGRRTERERETRRASVDVFRPRLVSSSFLLTFPAFVARLVRVSHMFVALVFNLRRRGFGARLTSCDQVRRGCAGALMRLGCPWIFVAVFVGFDGRRAPSAAPSSRFLKRWRSQDGGARSGGSAPGCRRGASRGGCGPC